MWFVDRILVPVDIRPSGVIEVLYRKPDRVLRLYIWLETLMIQYYMFYPSRRVAKLTNRLYHICLVSSPSYVRYPYDRANSNLYRP